MTSDEQESYARNQARVAELEARRTRIRTLNDVLRTTGVGGRLMITSGVQSLPAATLKRVVDAMVTQASFDDGNDPHGEHDFGAVEADGVRVFWKIDCYDKQLEYGSPDAADPDVTARVLTIMLADEY